MKKIIYLITILSISLTASADIIISKKGGGQLGYKKVKETHGTDHTLKCSDPGREKCEWQYPPLVTYSKSVAQIVEIIEHNILNNGFEGGTLVIEMPEGNLTVIVTEVSISEGIPSYVAQFASSL